MKGRNTKKWVKRAEKCIEYVEKESIMDCCDQAAEIAWLNAAIEILKCAGQSKKGGNEDTVEMACHWVINSENWIKEMGEVNEGQ